MLSTTRKSEALASANAVRFMHIPKTGGKSIAEILRKMEQAGYQTLPRFGHAATLRRIIREHPGIRVSFLLRDPIERVVSGFSSRLRMGRPAHDNPWKAKEAAVFAIFPDAKALLAGITSEDERMRSAVDYTFRSLNHLQNNYLRYFESVEFIDRHRDRIALVGEMDRYDDFLRAYLPMLDPRVTDISPFYAHKHKAPESSKSVLDQFSDAERARFAAFFEPEYKVYNRLRQLINC